MASAARGPKQPQVELLKLGPVAGARAIVMRRRESEGADVKQADVDLVAEGLIRAAVRPYPRAIVAVIGGSLSTVTPMFDDWWQRFAIRQLNPETPGLDSQSKISLQFRHLVAQWEIVLREHLTGAADPNEALIAAAKLGEQQGLRLQLTALTAERDRLVEGLEALTYKVAELETRLAAQHESAAAAQTEFFRALTGLTAPLGQPTDSGGREAEVAALTQLAAEIHQLRKVLPRPTRRSFRRPKKTAPAKSRRPGRRLIKRKSRKYKSTSKRPRHRR